MNSDPATDPAAEWDGRAWGATDRIRSLPTAIGLGAALDAFCAGKAAEGLSPRSIVWYRMIGERLVGRFGAARPVDTLTATELRAWLVELRATLAPMSVAGYVRGLHAFGNWLASDGLAAARAVRALARPRVPRKVIEPLSRAGEIAGLVAKDTAPRFLRVATAAPHEGGPSGEGGTCGLDPAGCPTAAMPRLPCDLGTTRAPGAKPAGAEEGTLLAAPIPARPRRRNSRRRSASG